MKNRMTEEIRSQQTAEETVNPNQPRRQGHLTDTGRAKTRMTPEFNRYIYENLITNLDSQIEYWNRKADNQSTPQEVQVLRLKAEGLGYALRLLNAFEPEFRELVECASRAATE